jgi:hypothetical protein
MNFKVGAMGVEISGFAQVFQALVKPEGLSEKPVGFSLPKTCRFSKSQVFPIFYCFSCLMYIEIDQNTANFLQRLQKILKNGNILCKCGK